MLRSVIENAQHFAVYRVQVDLSRPYNGRVQLVSPWMSELTGVEDIYRFENWLSICIPMTTLGSWKLTVALKEGSVYNQPARFFNAKENQWRWVQTIFNPRFDIQGKLTHFDGMIIDRTDQKEAEIALEESQWPPREYKGSRSIGNCDAIGNV